jgi:hypothetical protein
MVNQDAGDAAAEDGEAAAAGAAVVSSQQQRALAAARELEEFALLYGDDDDEEEDADMANTSAQQQQQQQASPAQQQGDNQQQQEPASCAANGSTTAAAAAAAAEDAGVAPSSVGLVGGRADVYHIVLEVAHDAAGEVTLRCFNPYRVSRLISKLASCNEQCMTVLLAACIAIVAALHCGSVALLMPCRQNLQLCLLSLQPSPRCCLSEGDTAAAAAAAAVAAAAPATAAGQ